MCSLVASDMSVALGNLLSSSSRANNPIGRWRNCWEVVEQVYSQGGGRV